MNGANKRGFFGPILVLIALLLCGCRAADPILPPVKVPTQTPSATSPAFVSTAFPSPEPTAAPSETPFLPTSVPEDGPVPPPPRTQYFLDARLDYDDRILDVEQMVIYVNRTAETLNELLLLVDANWTPGVFELVSLTWGEQEEVETFFLDGGFLTVPFPAALEPEQTATVRLTYRLHIPYAASKLGYYARQFNLCDWYPIVAVHRPGGKWLAYPPSPVGETLVYDTGDYEVRLAVQDAPDGLEIAASLPIERADDAYLFEGTALRSFAMSLSNVFEVLRAQAGDVQVASYFREEDRSAGMAALQTAVQSINVFAEIFGPYPFESYSAVEGNFPDGLEFDGLAFTGSEYYEWYDGTTENYLTLITVHEAAHQWWYSQVGNDQAFEPWVDEALAIYSEYLYLEETHPELTGWWWEFRLDEFRPLYGFVDTPVYAYRSYRPYVDAVYLRGAEMMHAIRMEIGREAFLEALRAYLDAYRGGFAAGQDLIDQFKEVSGKQIDAVLTPYFSPGQ